ncbi:glycosyltransferase family 2 protein [Streptomyces sp. NPDC056682]|uniref:glycosyltransferase family 2 protein n=1 Tax=Streptomyces sp. NPDC056682 TaxID=3345909 RepID=UPI0036A85E31
MRHRRLPATATTQRLPAARPGHHGRPHPARPVPPDGQIVRDGDPRLFWSLSFALTAATWERVGGLCEDYTGYGAEDTDFAARATSRGVGLWWMGGAPAYTGTTRRTVHPFSTSTTSSATGAGRSRCALR